MSFSFNFTVDADSDDGTRQGCHANLRSISNSCEPISSHPEPLIPARRLDVDTLDLNLPIVGVELISVSYIDASNSCKLELKKVVSATNANIVDDSTDLVPGVYEGGLKVWEGTIDLLRYMMEEKAGTQALGKTLELGCGHGLPGILALQQGADRVVFSDYNSEVIKTATLPNVVLNTTRSESPLAESAAFYCGDWNGLPALLYQHGEGPFDTILTAETLYTERAVEQVVNIIAQVLAPGGQAIIAAKRYYFGCGGGCDYLRTLAAGRGLECNTVRVMDTGSGNIREIVRVTWRAAT